MKKRDSVLAPQRSRESGQARYPLVLYYSLMVSENPLVLRNKYVESGGVRAGQTKWLRKVCKMVMQSLHTYTRLLVCVLTT